MSDFDEDVDDDGFPIGEDNEDGEFEDEDDEDFYDDGLDYEDED